MAIPNYEYMYPLKHNINKYSSTTEQFNKNDNKVSDSAQRTEID